MSLALRKGSMKCSGLHWFGLQDELGDWGLHTEEWPQPFLSTGSSQLLFTVGESRSTTTVWLIGEMAYNHESVSNFSEKQAEQECSAAAADSSEQVSLINNVLTFTINKSQLTMYFQWRECSPVPGSWQWQLRVLRSFISTSPVTVQLL